MPPGRSDMKKNGRKSAVRASSGNVFADLGFANPERETLKAQLMLQIYRLIRRRGITQAQAGEILGIRQPNVSALMRGQSGVFSVERLMEFLTHLGQDVRIRVVTSRSKQASVSLVSGQ